MPERPHTDRRQVLRLAAAAATTPLVGAAAAPAARATTFGKGTELVLIGTAAGPVPMAGRTGISSALVVDGRVHLIDLGHGAFDQFDRAGLAIKNLDAIFITHLHSDHIADLYTLPFLRFGGIKPMTHPVDVYGPGRAGALPTPYPPGRQVPVVHPENPTPGLTDLIQAQIAATAYDLNLRMRDEGWPDLRTLVRPHDIALPDVGASPTGDLAPAMRPFTVMSNDQVRVSAILVRHPPVFPSFAFRFDTAHGSVVFSGDTTVTPNIVTLARGADVLVHEVIDMQIVKLAGNLSPGQIQHHQNSHTDVTKVGALAQQAGVKTLVLNHLAPGDKRLVPDAIWKHKARKGYDGRVIVGNDLMRIRV
ncbi:MBL fold metallo-hydrolase [Actinomadura sp. 6N118]|uniref:MBL fold metallo-hydrolase n=1 Tax=Actinomadura sp. 6N118 TaxID=3375151 RepID=UPI00378A0342